MKDVIPKEGNNVLCTSRREFFYFGVLSITFLLYCYSSATASGDIIQPIASAKLTTEESFNFTFGTVEIRAKMPKRRLDLVRY